MNLNKYMMCSLTVLLLACVPKGATDPASADSPKKSDTAGSGGTPTVPMPKQANSSVLIDQHKTVGIKVNTVKTCNTVACTGKDVKIGVIENSFFANDITELAGRYDSGLDSNGTEGFLGEANTPYTPSTPKKMAPSAVSQDHGTLVAQMIAGATYGIAKDSKIVAYKIAPNSTDQATNYMTTAYNHAVDNNVTAINMSIGFWANRYEYTGITDNKEADTAYNTRMKKILKSFLNGVDTDKNPRTGMVESMVGYTNEYAKTKPIFTISTGNVTVEFGVCLNSEGCVKMSEEKSTKDKDGNFTAVKDKDGNLIPEKKQFTQKFRARNPTDSSRIGVLIPAVEKYFIAVSGMLHTGTKKGVLSGLPCGDTQRYCVTAAMSYKGQLRDKTPTSIAGTSFSAPTVAGGLALLKQKFGSSKNNQWIRNRILSTAKFQFPDGSHLKVSDGAGKYVNADTKLTTIKDVDGVTDITVSDIHGRGVMRLDLALVPVGGVSAMSYSTNVSTAMRTDIKTLNIAPSAVFGDGVKNAFSGINMVVLDSMDAPFTMNMAGFVNDSTVISSQPIFENPTYAFNMVPTDILQNNAVVQYTAQSFNPRTQKMGFRQSSQNTTAGVLGQHMSMQYNSNGISYVSHLNTTGTKALQDISTNIKFSNITFTPKVSVLLEKDSVLGMTGASAYKLDSLTSTVFAGADMAYQSGKNKVYAYGYMGQSYSDSSGAFITDIATINSALSGIYYTYNNHFGVGYKMPLRVSKAHITVNRVIKHNMGETLSYQSDTTDIAPSGKQQTIEMFYKNSLSKGVYDVRVLYTKDINHIADVNDTTAIASYKIQF